MREFIITIVILTIALIICLAQDAKGATAYNNMDSTFTTIVKGDDLLKIETWEQPRTQYTPSNLKSQYQMRFTGKDGSNRVTSYTLPITDYDTKIIEGGYDETTGYYYVRDNANNRFITGKNVDVGAINDRINNLSNQTQSLQNQVNKLDNKLEGGLATVTALTGLHPNPRATEKLEVSVATGIYADNVAGAIGMFYHPNDRVQLNVGASYGGDSQFAGSCGITFSLGRKRR